MKCNHCGETVKTDCDWRQGRCPHRPAMVIVSDQYKARYYNLIQAIKNLFKR